MVLGDSRLVPLPRHQDERGLLIALEEECENVPFPIRRVYWISSVPSGCSRGFHAHTDLEQILICVCGSVSILVDDGRVRQTYSLSRSDKGLYLGPMIWREMFDFSDNAVLLVLASKKYDENDYINDYDKFMLTTNECEGGQSEGSVLDAGSNER